MAHIINNRMLQPTEESLVKIDAVISGIRMINLHVFNFLCEHPHTRRDPKDIKNEKARELLNQQLKRLNAAHMQEHLKFISDYIKKCLKDMSKVKLVLSPLAYRPFRQKLQDQEFLRFENNAFGVKFIFTDLFKQCLLNVEIYRKVLGGRVSGLATSKLEMTFLYELSLRYPDAMLTYQLLEQQGRMILDEVTLIFNGQKCCLCHRHQDYNPEVMCFLPPTVREFIELKEGKRDRKYYHESCL